MKWTQQLPMALCVCLALAACKKEERLTEVGDINLAGCDVPAGLTLTEAEKVTCHPIDASEDSDAVAPDAPNETPRAVLAFKPDMEVISAAIAQKAKEDGGVEYSDAREVVEGDLAGDGVAEVAVLYVLEGAGGGNRSINYLAAFVREAGQLKLASTLILHGSAEAIELSGGKVHVKLLILGEDDPLCCPSVEEEAIYVLHGGKLVQIREQS